MAVKYIKGPAYYSKFQCIGDKCPQDCCHGWRIDWGKSAVERLKAAECSEELKKIIDVGFADNPAKPDSYKIDLDEDGKCPFLENGLCKIQKELGDGYFSDTCRDYPRHITAAANYRSRTCNTSCYAVLDLICEDENSMEMASVPIRGTNITGTQYSQLDMMNHPAIEYFGDIQGFLIDLISDKTHSLETSLVLGAVAAKTIDRYVAEGKAKQIPSLLKQLTPQVNDPAQIATLENVKPNYSIKFGFGQAFIEAVNSESFQSVFEDGVPVIRKVKRNYIANLLEDGKISKDKFIDGENKFYEVFSGREFVIRNIALNILLECDMPLKNRDYSIYDNYCCFIAQIAAVKIIAATAGYEGGTDEEIEFRFKKTLAKTARIMCHTVDYTKYIVDLMKQYNCTSPAHLAYVLK